MTIYDIREIPHKGVVIGGVNPEFDVLLPDEIQEIIGDSITIQNPDGSVFALDVADVEITTSLIEQKNIFGVLSMKRYLQVKFNNCPTYSQQNPYLL